MTNEERNKLAEVLTKVAEYINNIEAEKLAAVKKELEPLAAKLSEAAGENIDVDTIQKIAQVDKKALDLLQKVASTATADVGTMGGPAAEKQGHTKEASADDSFLTWIME